MICLEGRLYVFERLCLGNLFDPVLPILVRKNGFTNRLLAKIIDGSKQWSLLLLLRARQNSKAKKTMDFNLENMFTFGIEFFR